MLAMPAALDSAGWVSISPAAPSGSVSASAAVWLLGAAPSDEGRWLALAAELVQAEAAPVALPSAEQPMGLLPARWR